MNKAREYAESIAALARAEDIKDDNETVHAEADKILLAALRKAGWGEVADAWDALTEKIPFWYA